MSESALVKQNIDHSLPATVDRFWTEILLNSFVFDRHIREVSAALLTCRDGPWCFSATPWIR